MRGIYTRCLRFREHRSLSQKHFSFRLMLALILLCNSYCLLPDYCRGELDVPWALAVSAVCLVWHRPVLPSTNCFLLMAKSQSGCGFLSRTRFSFFSCSSFLLTSHSVTGDVAILVAAFEGERRATVKETASVRCMDVMHSDVSVGGACLGPNCRQSTYVL